MTAKEDAAKTVEDALYDVRAADAGYLGREECQVLARVAIGALAPLFEKLERVEAMAKRWEDFGHPRAAEIRDALRDRNE